jgi:acyl dehydratase
VSRPFRLAPGALLPARRAGPITAAHVKAFSDISGDRNPIHLEADAAKSVGLDAPPVHGLQLVALMHEAVAAHQGRARIAGFSTRFLAPVPVGDVVEITGRVVKAASGRDRGEAIVRVFLHRGDGTLACLGEAVLVPAADMALT